MTTISTVCKNLFTTTALANLERIPCRGVRRNLARAIYRHARRPGLVNPVPEDQLPPKPGNPKTKNTRCVQRPMRHVYKLHEPPYPKRRLLMSAVKNLPLRA